MGQELDPDPNNWKSPIRVQSKVVWFLTTVMRISFLNNTTNKCLPMTDNQTGNMRRQIWINSTGINAMSFYCCFTWCKTGSEKWADQRCFCSMRSALHGYLSVRWEPWTARVRIRSIWSRNRTHLRSAHFLILRHTGRKDQRSALF